MAKKRIFKSGDYGEKGKYTTEDFNKWISSEFSFPITIGHIGDYVKNKVPITAIPKAGVATCVEVDNEGYLIADVEYNEFGKDVTDLGAYDNYSLGIDILGKPNHLALLGYALPHIKDLDSAYVEFSEGTKPEDFRYVEFTQGGQMTLEEILSALNELSPQEKITAILSALKDLDVTQVDVSPLLTRAWELDDQQWYINKLTGEGYTVAKTSEFTKTDIENMAKAIGFDLIEAKTPKTLTKEQWESQYAAEFARKQEENQYKDKFIKLFPPVMQKLAEFCATEAYKEENYKNIIEFSEEKKISMADYIKETIEKGGPFKRLFTSVSAEFTEDLENDDSIAGIRQKSAEEARKRFGGK
ncbi:MAG: hypothetical protein MJH09_00930 [Cetobacterium sp.]|nr:hypothetical protein [Cetobacterium sp.]